jgi:muconolactone delta-isomerase
MAERSADGLLTAAGATRELWRLGVDFSEASLKRLADHGEISVQRTTDRGVRLFRQADLAAFAKARRS